MVVFGLVLLFGSMKWFILLMFVYGLCRYVVMYELSMVISIMFLDVV